VTKKNETISDDDVLSYIDNFKGAIRKRMEGRKEKINFPALYDDASITLFVFQ
jgi:hypothetical protein